MNAPLPAARYHDDLSRDYHLLYQDWDQAIVEQARVVDALIQAGHGPAKGPVLDCACGIGTQALGLAALGYTVTGADISPKALARAAREARRKRLAVRFVSADVRELPKDFRDAFDVVVGMDDPLSHLAGSGELRIAFLGMRTALRSGGLAVLSSRDYDRLRETRPREMAFQHRTVGSGTVISFQIWDWDTGAPTYVNSQFILRSRWNGWKTLHLSTRQRAYTRKEIADEMEAAGFGSVRWHEPADTGYIEPIVTGVSPS